MYYRSSAVGHCLCVLVTVINHVTEQWLAKDFWLWLRFLLRFSNESFAPLVKTIVAAAARHGLRCKIDCAGGDRTRVGWDQRFKVWSTHLKLDHLQRIRSVPPNELHHQ